MTQRRIALKRILLSLAGVLGIGYTAKATKIIVTPGGTTAKNFYLQIAPIGVIEVPFLMANSGTITSILSSGITTIQYKKNAGSYATPTFPIIYAANDIIWFTWAFSDIANLSGNLLLKCTDA